MRRWVDRTHSRKSCWAVVGPRGDRPPLDRPGNNNGGQCPGGEEISYAAATFGGREQQQQGGISPMRDTVSRTTGRQGLVFHPVRSEKCGRIKALFVL